MTGALGGRRLRGALALALALLPLAPASRVAADDGMVELAAHSLWSVVVDLDGDGEREVVAVRGGRTDPDARTEYLIQAWSFRAGAWRSLGTAPLLRWDTGADRNLRPARVDTRDSVGLLVVSRDGMPTALAASSIVDEEEQRIGGCCLSIGWIELRDGRISLAPLEGDFGPVESLSVLDVDGDGTDELFVTEQTAYDEVEPPASTYALLRQRGDGFVREPIELPEETEVSVASTDDSDGVVGDDLLFVGHQEQTMLRVVDDGVGSLRFESAEADGAFDGRLGGWISGVAGGALVMVEEQGLSLLRWPRGGAPARVAEVETEPFPWVHVVGDGPDARVIEMAGIGGVGGGPLAIRVYDSELRLERYLPAPQVLNEVWRLSNQYSGRPIEPLGYLYPHVGPVPGGIDGRPAFLGYGSLITIEADGSLRVRAAAPLVSTGIAGAAGPSDGWLLSAPEGVGAGGSTAYLGMIGEPPRTQLRVLPLETLLDAAGSRDPAITVQGATEIGSGVDRRLVAGEGGFQVRVDGEPGTAVVVSAGRELSGAEIIDGPVTLTIDPGSRGDRNRPFEAAVVVVRPSGIASGARWDAEILREPPEVTVDARVEPFALRAAVFGRVTGGAAVTVDGQPVETNRNGGYRADVDAPIWPREVLVIARDPVGNETVQRIEINGFVDYRGLPWIPIIAVLTAVAGVVLFLRTPRLRPQPALLPDGDGRLEEVDGDVA